MSAPLDDFFKEVGLPLKAELKADTATRVWFDNWDAVSLLCALATQWRCGSRGFYGLDYGPLFKLMHLRGLERHPMRWQEVFEDVQYLESAIMREWSRNHGK